jgi:osmotically inducible protein OsmC
MQRSGSAIWQGTLKEGKGSVSTQSGILRDTPYSFVSRFESGTGTNPEELIAAAHAGCFAMALSGIIGRAGFTPERLASATTVTLEQVQGNWTITTVALQLEAKIPGIDQAKFDELAAEAKKSCPVSRLLNANIKLEATLQ